MLAKNSLNLRRLAKSYQLSKFCKHTNANQYTVTNIHITDKLHYINKLYHT